MATVAPTVAGDRIAACIAGELRDHVGMVHGPLLGMMRSWPLPVHVFIDTWSMQMAVSNSTPWLLARTKNNPVVAAVAGVSVNASWTFWSSLYDTNRTDLVSLNVEDPPANKSYLLHGLAVPQWLLSARRREDPWLLRDAAQPVEDAQLRRCNQPTRERSWSTIRGRREAAARFSLLPACDTRRRLGGEAIRCLCAERNVRRSALRPVACGRSEIRSIVTGLGQVCSGNKRRHALLFERMGSRGGAVESRRAPDQGQ